MLFADGRMRRIGEGVAFCGIVGLALALRLDGFMVVPRFTDETWEVLLGRRMALEGSVPLVGVQPYIGGLFSYLVALAFLLLGPKIEAGRVVAVVSGALTILPTCLLAREMARALWGPGSRSICVGLLAGLLLAVSGPHIFTSSRIAYSNSLTPLFTMTSLWLFQRGICRRSTWALALAGGAGGLAVQTHVTALTLAPGVALALAVSMATALRRGGWKSVWPRPWVLPVAASLALLVNLNLLVYNLTGQAESVGRTELRIGRYLGAEPWSVGAWGGRLVGLLKASALAVGGLASEDVLPPAALGSPSVLLAVGLAFGGLWVTARHGLWLPCCVVMSVLVVVSLFNSRVEPVVPRLRHYGSLVPLGMALIAVSIGWLEAHIAGWGRLRWAARIVALLLPAVLVATMLSASHLYVLERLARPEKNNDAYLRVVRALAGDRQPQERVYIDAALVDVVTLSGGRMLTHLRYAMDVNGQEFEVIRLSERRLPVGTRGITSRRVVLSAESAALVESQYRVVAHQGDPGEGAPLRVFRAYPLERAR